jgi:hypothetical protein
MLGIHTFDQGASLCAISAGTFCNKHSERNVATLIHCHSELLKLRVDYL